MNNGYSGERRKYKKHSKDSIMPQCEDVNVSIESKNKTSQQSSCNDIIVIESHSINHISTLTVFKGHQGSSQTHKPHKKSSSDRKKLAVSTNEGFLSNNRRCELVPVYVHDPKPQASIPSVENQQVEEGTNQTLDELVGGDCGCGQNPKTTLEKPHILQANGIKDIQPITTSDNQQTDQSKPELCIYEEIQFSTDPDGNQRSQTNGDEKRPSNRTVNESGSSHAEVKEYNTTEKSQTGSDVMSKGGKEKKSVMKSAVINHHVQDCRPRITVVSTSL